MKAFWKILKWALLLLLAVFVLLFALGLVYVLGWPVWTWFVVVAGFAAMGLAGLWGYKAWLRRKEQAFVQEIIATDEARLATAEPSEKEKQAALQAKWREAVETLRRSHLRKYGNPLYVLPWYMVIGESRTGKTTAIRNAQLSSPFAQPSPTAGPGSTVDCDWWFFDQAVVLDMAGRYAVGTEQDQAEWLGFLRLLTRYRRQEPINGLICTVSVENLKGRSEGAVQQDALRLRQRVDELMKVLGVRFPLYVLVTKCDLIEGMVPFLERLPESRWQEVLGTIRPIKGEEDPATFFDRAFDGLVTRLKGVRRELVGQGRPGEVCPFLLFPEELARLKGPLATFLGTLFKDTPYQDQPLFRGFYLTSGRQEGRPFSHFLEALGLQSAVRQLPSSERSCFLHDFFSKVLVSDRALLAPTQRALSWQRLSQSLGLAAWLLTALTLCGLLTLSFIRNVSAMRAVSRQMPVELRLGKDIFQNIAEMDRFRAAVDRLVEQNRGWWAPRMGLGQSLVLERKLGEQYVRLYQERCLSPVQDQVGQQIARVTATTPTPTVAAWVDVLTQQLNLLQARLEGKHREALAALRAPDYAFLLQAAKGPGGKAPPAGLAEAMRRDELAYLLFQGDEQPLKRLHQEDGERLRALLRTEGIGLFWLPAWANLQTESLQPVTYSRFWGGNTKLEGQVGPLVPRAYTPQGWIKIQGLITEIAGALDDPKVLSAHREAFEKVYRQQYWRAWEDFLTAFPRGELLWADRTGRRELAARLAGDQSPYQQLLNVLPVELGPALTSTDGQPSWGPLVARYARLQNAEYQQLLATKEQGVIDRIVQGGSKVYTWLQEGIKREAAVQVFRQDQLALEHLKAYEQSLNAFAHQVLTLKGAFDAASKAFGEGFDRLSEPEGVSLKAFWHEAKLEQALRTEERGEAPFWGLFRAPTRYLWRFCVTEAATHIEQLWEQDVLTETQGLSEQEAIETLLSPEGKVWQFVRGPAAPFTERQGERGYRAKEFLDSRIPFSGAFFSFLNQGKVGRRALTGSHQVHIEALPTDANSGATVKPHLTRLVLRCGSGAQELLNFNYPVAADFQWNSDDCQEVLLEIQVGDISLKRRYQDYDAFPRFLADFDGEAKTFRQEDFPREAKALEDKGISTVTVRYRFSGHKPLIKFLERAPQRVPKQIVSEDFFGATVPAKAPIDAKGGRK